MKKSLVLITAIVTIVGVILFGGLNNTKQSDITDDEGLAKEFVLQTYGEGYDVQLTNCDDEFVSFFGIRNGEVKIVESINRSYYQNNLK